MKLKFPSIFFRTCPPKIRQQKAHVSSILLFTQLFTHNKKHLRNFPYINATKSRPPTFGTPFGRRPYGSSWRRYTGVSWLVVATHDLKDQPICWRSKGRRREAMAGMGCWNVTNRWWDGFWFDFCMKFLLFDFNDHSSFKCIYRYVHLICIRSSIHIHTYIFLRHYRFIPWLVGWHTPESGTSMILRFQNATGKSRDRICRWSSGWLERIPLQIVSLMLDECWCCFLGWWFTFNVGEWEESRFHVIWHDILR